LINEETPTLAPIKNCNADSRSNLA
jgi:hypothetical protein